MCEIIPKLCEYDECILFALQLFSVDVVVLFLGICVRFIAFMAHIYVAHFYRSPAPRIEKFRPIVYVPFVLDFQGATTARCGDWTSKVSSRSRALLILRRLIGTRK